MEQPIAVDHLTRSYGKQRGVIDLTFSVQEGEIFAFLGPNGAGKTTTIRQLMGFLRPTRGSARIFGPDCWMESARVKTKVGFLPADIHLYEQMSGAEFLSFAARFRNGEHARRRKMLVERLDLDLKQKIKHLSKGNRQKLGIIQALMYDAPLLILDEPSTGLDPLKQMDFLGLLREEQSRGKTIFLSSHLLSEVERIAQRIAIIRDGRLITVEEVARLKAKRERRMELTLREPVAPERFSVLDGVRMISTDPGGQHVTLAVRGELAQLLRTLSELPVEDLTFAPADLESIFLHYYSDVNAPSLQEGAAK